ncbi:substrate-binding domain-containing protein [Vibrio sp. SS-MA-C1-2]|uniref:substrate-binding domain-containing protein n=1 Tax=Vibrio sp. SS-MA-C1-2 TaxID=2908646 RepID=UPI001F478718|nr:substrate-binding domain-containing protein [Vibrio sp. SS-MA-C1-2]UJF17632.1 substrate-binding domain-containing protein [Vibrio sp. SS-MA-C1-2]
MATMKDVAKLAKVSTSTVSHVFNKTRYVSDEIAQKVMDAVKELNYTPSALARSLKVNHTKTIGMLVTTSTNPFYGEVLKGVENRCYQQGYNLILCNTEGDVERLSASLDILLQKKVDGLLLMCNDYGLNLFSQHAVVPTVMMDWSSSNFPCDKIKDNSHAGGYLAGRYLIEKGHREIGCITGRLNRSTSQQRLSGLEQALSESGLDLNRQWLVEGDFECEGGYNAFNQLYQQGQLPSALFVFNDMMAMGVINAASKLGISIPDDLSLIGYDDVKLASYITPSLTTIHQPKYRLGEQAIDMLLNKINQPDSEELMVQLEPTLVERDSVKKVTISSKFK